MSTVKNLTQISNREHATVLSYPANKMEKVHGNGIKKPCQRH